MDSRSFLRAFFSMFVFFATISFSYGNVEVFSNYQTVLTVNADNTLHVNKTLTLKNVYDVGIVPGQIEFKIGEGTDGSVGDIAITRVEAKDRFGTTINSQIRNTDDFSTIILDVYYPLLPGFEYQFDLFYELTYEPGGIFFKNLQIPLRESTIPIERGEFRVNLPDNYHFTYLDSDEGNATIENGQAVWELRNDRPKSIQFEYSYLPVKIGELQGSYVFWISINVLLMIFLIVEVRREVKRIKSKEGR